MKERDSNKRCFPMEMSGKTSLFEALHGYDSRANSKIIFVDLVSSSLFRFYKNNKHSLVYRSIDFFSFIISQ